MKETNCLEKNPCVEKYYSGLTKEQRLAEINDCLKSLAKIVHNLEKEKAFCCIEKGLLDKPIKFPSKTNDRED